jgi:hypothetical protein
LIIDEVVRGQVSALQDYFFWDEFAVPFNVLREKSPKDKVVFAVAENVVVDLRYALSGEPHAYVAVAAHFYYDVKLG